MVAPITATSRFNAVPFSETLAVTLSKEATVSFIDTRSYDQHDMWKRYGKSSIWLSGYRAGFAGRPLASGTFEDYAEGRKLGLGDRNKESNPPHVKCGFGYGYGYRPDALD